MVRQALMSAPNPDDPLANDVADHWKADEAAALSVGAVSYTHLTLPTILLV